MIAQMYRMYQLQCFGISPPTRSVPVNQVCYNSRAMEEVDGLVWPDLDSGMKDQEFLIIE